MSRAMEFILYIIPEHAHALARACTQSFRINEEEVIGVVKIWESKTSTDYEDISMNLVKKVINCIRKPITYICNLSFSIGIFPEKNKIEIVVPLFKSADKCICTNYRRISLLPLFSKIL